MARNPIPQEYDPLVSLAEDALDGAQQHGGAIGLSQNTAVKIEADLRDLTGDPTATPPTPGKQGLWNGAKAAKLTAAAASRTAESNARAYCGKAVGVLKNYLGTQWNGQWAAAGFTNASLRIPDDPVPMLGELRASSFRRRFEAKGRFSGAMAAVPTVAVLHPHPGLLGAAAFARQDGSQP